MANWITIAQTDLENFVVAALVSAINEAALGDTQSDRFTVCQAAIINQVRMAVATHRPNALDMDTTKIPRSLLQPACWLIANAMAQGLGIALTESQLNEVTVARDLISDVASGDRAVEVPDSYDQSPDAQTGGMSQLAGYSDRSFTRDTMSGL